MRAKIRARASQEGIEKSVATKKAIEEATQRAMSGTSSATPDTMLDLSGFGEKFTDDGTDELTPEEQAEIDKIANMPLFDQLKEELSKQGNYNLQARISFIPSKTIDFTSQP